jgi:hypothetical protein
MLTLDEFETNESAEIVSLPKDKLANDLVVVLHGCDMAHSTTDHRQLCSEAVHISVDRYL